MQAKEIMSAPVVTAVPETTLKVVAHLMLQNDIGAIPILDDDGKLVGIVSEDDILPLQSIEDPRRHVLTKVIGSHRVPRTASEVMIRNVVTVTIDEDVTQVARLMHAMHLKTVPVLDRGKLAGIISRRDVLKILARSDASIQGELQQILDEQSDLLGRFVVTVSEGVVTLRGISDKSGLSLVERIARSVPGVVAIRVENAA